MFWNKKPTFTIKVKQNRYERFIIDELRISNISESELADTLMRAIAEIEQQLNALNGDEWNEQKRTDTTFESDDWRIGSDGQPM